MKYASLLCLLCLVLAAVTCKKTDKLAAALIDKTWLHSFEEDNGDTLVYRPNTYEFPPSRGRTGFMLESGGVIKRYEIAPTDGLEEKLGEWEVIDKRNVQIRMKPDSNPPQHYQVQILSLEGDVLKIRRQPIPGSN
ncbi:hypothetical protein ACFS7Z_06850 [Pontibacter toksunensis]|uniref:Lipocalin-like domain-containing protein n=1 Tax=Pontibacter toksunensis TaxID=1332631 RepID=A0ABW6BT09_9BACT